MSTFLIIDIQHPGLGDHLWHSHLPRLAKESGKYDKVYLTKSSIERMTDKETVFVWDTNPYFDGWHDGGASDKPAISQFLDLPFNGNIMDKVMQYYGLDDGKRDHSPELHYKSKTLTSVKGKIVYDPNYVSQAGDLTTEKVFDWMRLHKLLPDFQMAFRNRQIALSPTDILRPKSIKEFCDIIANCRDFICLNSGSALLAEALNVPCMVLYGKGVDDRTFSNLHSYVSL